MRLFRWAVTALKGRYGQLILEDHRQAKKNESSFWIHAAIPSAHHPGHDDVNAALISPWPGEYIVYGGSNG
jgi:hypothetical protein